MLTNKDYCDYDTCVALRELGYVGISRFFYATKESPLRRYSYDQILTTRIADAVGHTLAISLYSAQKWLREERGILLQPTYLELSDEWVCVIRDKNKRHGLSAQKQNTYEDALSEGIKEAIKILKEK